MNRPDDIPSAPAFNPASSSAIIAASSASVGARSAMPITMRRSVLWPTSMPAFTAVAGKLSRYSGNVISRNGVHGALGDR